MRRNLGTWSAVVVATAILAVAAGSGPAYAAKLLVDGTGVDGGDCGSKTLPCRSIGRAINNAGAGDTIIVGPGRYGDVKTKPPQIQ